MITDVILKVANGDQGAIDDLIAHLKSDPSDTYEALALSLKANNKTIALTEAQQRTLSLSLVNLNSNGIVFDWNYMLKAKRSFLHAIVQEAAFTSPGLSDALAHLLKDSRLHWNTPISNGNTSFQYLIFCLWKNHAPLVLEAATIVEQDHFDWNVVTLENESALYWFLSAVVRDKCDIIKTVPKLVERPGLDWLRVVPDRGIHSGTSPLYYLFMIAIKHPEYIGYLNTLLNKLFITEHNLPSFLDDMVNHKYCAKEAKSITSIFTRNRTYARMLDSIQQPPKIDINPALVDFYDRTQFSRSQPVTKELSDWVTPQILNEQLDFILSRRPEVEGVLNALKPNECYRIPKRYWGLDRTMNVLRTHDGTYKLILETKSKAAQHTQEHPTKRKSEHREGTHKYGKTAWRIDGKITKYYHLITKSNKRYNHNALEKEVSFSQELGDKTKHLLTYELGCYRHTGHSFFRSIYAVCAIGTYLEKYALFGSYSKVEKLTLIKDLLTACHIIHQNGDRHGDISSKNVLVMPSENGYYLVLSDYGTVRKIGDIEHNALTSYYYESPQISQWASTLKRTDKEIFQYYHVDEDDSLARSIWFRDPDQIETDNLSTIHPGDDLWSIGIILFKLLHKNNLPEYNDLEKIKSDPLLNGLLAIKRSDRLTSEQALQLCDSEIKRNRGTKQEVPTSAPAYTPNYNQGSGSQRRRVDSLVAAKDRLSLSDAQSNKSEHDFKCVIY